MARYCAFCEIAAKREPADILLESENVLVFRNRLLWVPVMLLAIPKRHMSQAELWSDMGEVGAAAVEAAQEHCPNGFRLISNSGYDGMQAQDPAHVPTPGGQFLAEFA